MCPFDPFDADRRRFLKLAGVAGLASMGAPVLALAQSKAPPGGPAPPADTTGKAAAAEKPPDISEDARALAGVIQRRYGQHLTAEQLELVTKELDTRIQGGRRLRDQKLANGDEPDITFKA